MTEMNEEGWKFKMAILINDEEVATTENAQFEVTMVLENNENTVKLHRYGKISKALIMRMLNRVANEFGLQILGFAVIIKEDDNKPEYVL